MTRTDIAHYTGTRLPDFETGDEEPPPCLAGRLLSLLLAVYLLPVVLIVAVLTAGFTLASYLQRRPRSSTRQDGQPVPPSGHHAEPPAWIGGPLALSHGRYHLN
jgi:hypothetical protein